MSSFDATLDNTRVIRHPHFHANDNQLFFLISKRPHSQLSFDERAVWDALEHEPSLHTLRAQLGPQAVQAVANLQKRGLCELAETDFPARRRRILIIEPHCDDAALSVGGTMWMQRHDVEFHVVTVASRSNFTSYYYLARDYFDTNQITALRQAEAHLFVRMLGAHHHTLGLTDAPLRYHDSHWTLDWFQRHRYSIAARTSHHAGPPEHAAWAAAIRDILHATPSEEIWIPLGSPHADHQLTRNACLDVLLQDPSLIAQRTIRFYQEVPYVARFPHYSRTVLDALTRAGAALTPESRNIESALNAKLRLVGLFGSQFKMDVMRPDVEASARADNGPALERFWKLERLPTHYHPLALAPDAPEIARSAQRLARWLPRHRNAARIRLLLLVPAGCWAEDIGTLLKTFPNSRFDVFVAPAGAAELADHPHPRISIHHVDAGAKAWALLALRLALTPPVPTLFIAGEKRLAHARRLARLWPGSDPLVLPTMDHLVRALHTATAPPDHNTRGAAP